MIILALDSSGSSASAAVTDGERMLSSFSVSSAVKHSATLLPMAEKALECAGLGFPDVEMFAVNTGPGSFTGVRIGVSLVKGLAFGTGKPVVSVSSVEALACGLAGFEGVACPVMDARRDQFYNAIFKDGVRLTPDRLITASALGSELEAFDCPVRFCGDGYKTARELIKCGNIVETPHRLTVADAYYTALCGWRSYNKGENIFTDETVSPVYLRPSQAERERNERKDNNEQ